MRTGIVSCVFKNMQLTEFARITLPFDSGRHGSCGEWGAASPRLCLRQVPRTHTYLVSTRMDLNSDESGNETDAYGKNSDDECVVLEVNAPRKRRRKRLTPLPKGHKSAARRRSVASTVPSTPAVAAPVVPNPPTATHPPGSAVPSGLALLTAAAATAATALRSVPQPSPSASKQAMAPKKKVPTGRPRGRPRKHPPVEQTPPPPPSDDVPDSDEAASNTESDYEGDDPESRRQRRTIRRNRRCIKDAAERRRFDSLSIVDQLTYRPTRDRSWKGEPRFNIATMRGRRGNLHRSYDEKHSEDVDETEGLQLVRDEFGGSPKSTASWADTDEDHVEEEPKKKPRRDASSMPRSKLSSLSSILATVPPPSCPSPGPAPHLLDADSCAGPSDADSCNDVFDGPGPVSTPTANQPVDDQTPVSNAPPGANLATPKVAYARWRKYTAPQRIDTLSPSLPPSSSSSPPSQPAAAATTNVVVGVPAQAPLPHPNLDEIIRRPRPVVPPPPPPQVQRSSSTTRTTTTTTTTTTTNRPLGLKWETKSSLELAESARRELEAQARREKPPTYFDPKFKSSMPCRYGSTCRYKNNGCAFVHPHQDDRKRKLEDTVGSSSSRMRREPVNQAPEGPQDVKRYIWRPPLPNHGFTCKTFDLCNKVERDSKGNILKPFHETARF